MRSAEHRWIFHQVSLWEIQIKYNIGRPQLPCPPQEMLPAAVTKAGFERRHIEDEAIYLLGKLPLYHRDPFDRLLIAHALLNGWLFATDDREIQRYPVRVFP